MRNIWGFALLITTGSLVSVLACSDEDAPSDPDDAGSGGDAGSPGGGTGNAGSPGGGTGAVGDAGSSGAGDGGRECSGPGNGVGGGPPAARQERVRCYPAEVRDGEAQCLPPDDPAVIALVSQAVSSCGFVAEFVISAEESAPLPEACADSLECCPQITDSQQGFCGNLFREAEAPTAEACTQHFQTYAARCPDAGPGGAGAGGAGSGGASGAGGAGSDPVLSTHALCCYVTCGSQHCS